MASTVILSQVLGLFLVIVGSIVLIRRHAYIGIISGFVGEGRVRIVTGMIELMAGLFLVVLHQAWSSAPAAIISLLGWIAVIEAVAYLALPEPVLARMVNALNRPVWYVTGGVFAIAVGLYLAGYGFGYLRT